VTPRAAIGPGSFVWTEGPAYRLGNNWILAALVRQSRHQGEFDAFLRRLRSWPRSMITSGFVGDASEPAGPIVAPCRDGRAAAAARVTGF
jgi:hypothetical protein